MQLLFKIVVVYKNDILKRNCIQTILFFKYFFNLCYCLKTFRKLCYFSKINPEMKALGRVM